MQRIFITHHLGLGDHLLCNGIYRAKAAEYDFVYFVVKSHYRDELKRMLGDLDNVRIIGFSEHVAHRAQVLLRSLAKGLGFQTLSLGFFGEDFFQEQNRFRLDEDFYHQADLPLEQRWMGFQFQRDHDEEQRVFLELGCADAPYIFLHEDPTRAFLIDRNRISSALRIVTPTANTNFFNYAKVLEGAAELHLMESSFAALVEGMQLNQPKYAHRYARPEAHGDRRHEFTYKGDWDILT